jgi:hypothetical protein
LLIVVDKIVGGNFVGGGEVKGNETLLRFDNLVRFEQRLFKILNYKISFVERAKLAIQAAANFLRKSTETGAVAQRNEPNKAEETKRLIEYINANHLWNCDINLVNNGFVNNRNHDY